MFRRVCGQVLPDIAQVSDFLQITVHALIAYDRQAEAFFSAYGMFLVFFEDGKRNRQQGDVADRRCPVSALQFYTSFSDPPVTVVVLHEVVFCQCGHIGEGQPGVARKKHLSKGDRNEENQTQPVVNKRFCSCLPLQPNSRERQDNARFPLPSHYLFHYLPEA